MDGTGPAKVGGTTCEGTVCAEDASMEVMGLALLVSEGTSGRGMVDNLGANRICGGGQ